MKKLLFGAALFIAAAFPSCSKHDGIETPDLPDPQPLAIVFAEGNSLQFDADETKIVHYTITGGSDNTVVKVEMQNPNDAYTVESTPTSATEGTITITAKTPTDNCVLVSVSNSSQTVTMVIVVSPKSSSQELAITFAEGNSLEFDVGETKTVHYTIMGGSANNVVKVEMQNPDGAYALSTTQTSATEGTIKITAKTPTDNRVIVTVSDGSQTIMAPIDVTVILKASFDGKTVAVETPGTLAELLADYDETTITELTVIGNLNSSDIATLKNLPNLAVLDMEHVNLEELRDYAFYNNNNESLTSVKLPLTLKTIGNSAFWYCSSLTSITIPDSVTSIGNDAFSGCRSLTGVYITDIAKWCAIEFKPSSSNPLAYACNLYLNGELVTELVIPDSVTSIGSYAFRGCSGLTSVTIPNSVTEIGYSVFYNCRSLTSITIPDGVTSIGIGAFRGCSSLTSITIPDGVTSIGNEAFRDCSSLTSITIPDDVTSIGERAFSGCRSLTSIYCKAQTPPTINTNTTFNGVSETIPLYVPIGSADAYRAAEYWKRFTNINEMEFE